MNYEENGSEAAGNEMEVLILGRHTEPLCMQVPGF